MQSQACLSSAERAGLRPKGNVPTLRFPEFTGEWELHPTTDFFEFKNGLNPDSKRFGSGTKFISVMDILNNRYITYDIIKAFVEPKGKDLNEFGVNYGDVLFQRSSETLEDVGRANVYLDKKTALFGGFVIRGKKIGEYNPLFFRYLLSSPHVRKRIVVKGAGAQHFNIGQDGLSKVSIFVPTAKEQERIAQLLDLIDERIEAQNRIIEDLKGERKYLLEQLFCFPNERVPKLRLKGMTGEWQKVKLCYIANRVTEKNKANTCNRVLTIAAQYGLIDQQEFFNKQIASSDLTTYYLLHKGDFAYNKSYSGDYSWGAVKRLDKYDKGVLSSLYICFRPNENVDSDFLCHYFQSTKWYRGISEISGEGARHHGLLNMSVDDYFNILHRIPTLREQKAVANALNVLVDKIDIETEILNDLQKQKSYLLKEMFI